MPYNAVEHETATIRESSQTDIRAVLGDLTGMIGEAYCALSAVSRFLYGEGPVIKDEVAVRDPMCFAAELSSARSRACEVMELAQTLAKRLGA